MVYAFLVIFVFEDCTEYDVGDFSVSPTSGIRTLYETGESGSEINLNVN